MDGKEVQGIAPKRPFRAAAAIYWNKSIRFCEVEWNVYHKHTLSEEQTILRVPLSTQTESFQSLQEQKCPEWVHASPKVTQNFYTGLDNESEGAESLAEFQTVVAFRGLSEGREPSWFGPVEFTCTI